MRAACELPNHPTPVPLPRPLTPSHSRIFLMVAFLLSEVHFVANYHERSVWHVMANFWDP